MAKKVKKAARKGRNRAAQDITLINLRALKKRVEALELWSHRMADLAAEYWPSYAPALCRRPKIK